MHCKLVSPDHQIYRLSFIPHTYQDLIQIISQKLSLPLSQPIKLKYQDVDQELITLNNQEDLQTAVLTSQSENLKCLKIYILPDQVQKLEAKAPIPEAPDIDKEEEESKRELLKRSFIFERKGAQKTQEKNNNVKDQFIVDRKLMRAQIRKALTAAPACKIHDNQKQQVTGLQYLQKEDLICGTCQKRIAKVQYVCLVCPSTIYCEECEVNSTHEHPLLKMRSKHMKLQSNNSQNFPINRSIFKDEKFKKIGDGGGPRSLLGKSIISSSVRTSTNSSEEDHQGLYRSKVKVHFEQKTYNVEGERVWEFSVTLRNSGKQAWPANVRLICINGICKGQVREIPALNAQEKIQIKLCLNPPEKITDTASHLSQWKLYYENNGTLKSFGNCFFLKIYEGKTTKATGVEVGVGVAPGVERKIQEDKEEIRFEKREEKKNVLEEKAEALNVMFPGNLEEKKRFVQECPLDYDIYKLVDAYLLTLRDLQQRRSFVMD